MSSTRRTFDLESVGLDPEATTPAGRGVPLYEGPAERYDEDGREVGRGGIGRVVLATDRSLGRRVAIKRLLTSTVTPGPGTTLRHVRFVREAQVASQLEHPGVVPVYDAGIDADGEPFYVMRWIRGRTLAEALAACGSRAERWHLLPHVARLAHAVGFAHARGVVHRDLKPDNTMIGDFGETVVLDWGHARVRDGEGEEGGRIDLGPAQPTQTLDGSVLGTPAYMSPEQARGQLSAVDARSDVWSLGAILHEVLTGEVPFHDASVDAVLERARAGRARPIRELDRTVPADLAAIVDRAMAPDPADRYPTASELARDLEAWQSGERVEAYSYSTLEVLRRLAVRHRAVLAAAGAGLAVCTIVAAALWRGLVVERDRAVRAEELAVRAEDRAEHLLTEAVLRMADEAAARRDHHGARLLYAEVLGREEVPRARGYVTAFEALNPPVLVVMPPEGQGARVVTWAPDGRHLAAWTGPEVVVWETAGFSVTGRVPTRGRPALAFTGEDLVLVDDGVVRRIGPDGAEIWSTGERWFPVLAADAERVLAVRRGEGTNEAVVMDAADGAVRRIEAIRRVRISSAALGPDGAAAVGGDHVVSRWTGDGPEVHSSVGSMAPKLARRPDGSGWLVATQTGLVGLQADAESAPLDLWLNVQVDGGAARSASWSADGAWFAIHWQDGTTRIWAPEFLELAATFSGAPGEAALSPVGFRLATADGALRVWELASDQRWVFNARRPVAAVDPIGAERVFAWTGLGSSPWVVDTEGRPATQDLTREVELAGSRSIVYEAAGEHRLRDVVTGEERPWPGGPEPRAVSFGPGVMAQLHEGGRLVVERDGAEPVERDVGDDVKVIQVLGDTVWGIVRDGRALPLDPPGEAAVLAEGGLSLAWPSPSLERLVVVDETSLRMIDTAELVPGARPRTLFERTLVGEPPTRIAVDHEDRRLAFPDGQGGVELWDLTTGRELAVLPGVVGATSLAFSADGRALVVAQGNARVRTFPLGELDRPAAEVRREAEEEAGAWLDGTEIRPGRRPR